MFRSLASFGLLLALFTIFPPAAAAQISVGYPGPYGRGAYDLSSSVRVQVTPRETDVFVDGYYAGKADDFDGVFQRLRVEPGDHEIQLFLPGHRLYSQKVYLQPGNTFRIRHTMERLGAGEAEPERPIGTPRTPPAGRRGAPGSRTVPGADDRAPAAAADYGTISLRVQPEAADVLIDGQRWDDGGGDARLLVQLAPGPHTIEVRKPGYRDYLTEVTVRAGETLTVNVALASGR